MQGYQSKILTRPRALLMAFDVTNDVTLHSYFKIPTIKETIKEFYQRYCDKLEKHSNNLAANLIKVREIVRRLKKKRPTDLLIFHS